MEEGAEISTSGPEEMTGFIAIRAKIKGRDCDLWQEVRGGEVVGLVNAKGQPVDPGPAVEMSVLDGQLLTAPGKSEVAP